MKDLVQLFDPENYKVGTMTRRMAAGMLGAYGEEAGNGVSRRVLKMIHQTDDQRLAEIYGCP